jgi:serine/threonine-protein kinase
MANKADPALYGRPMAGWSIEQRAPHLRRFGPYFLLSKLNEPFVGSLHLAVAPDRGFGRLTALKILGPRLTDAGDVARFRDEASAVARLSHRNLVPVLDAGLVGDEPYLAMELVEGRDLRAMWNRCARKRTAFPLAIAVYLVKELCHGLAHVHASTPGLVHRNATPAKVLVSYTGEVKLADFSLALSAPALERTEPEFVYGKISYLSPEQARAEALDGRSDLYTAGIVLWELLTGRQLFPPSRKPTRDLRARTGNPEVVPPSQRAPRVPVALDEICRSALAGSKLDRYAGCNEMAMAMQTWLARNAPTLGDTQVAAFMQELFAEDREFDRMERAALATAVACLLGTS